MDVIQTLLNKNINTPRMVGLLFGLFSLALSLLMFPFDVGGDQLVYNEYYSGLRALGFEEAYLFFHEKTGSFEPGYFVLTYFLSPWFTHTGLMTALNALLGYYIASWLQKNDVSFFVIIIICCFNFYLMVLFFSADRLKLAFLFFFMAVSHNSFRRSFLLFAITSHVQLAMLGILGMVDKLVRNLRRLLLGQVVRPSFVTVAFALFFVVAVFFLHEYIIDKFRYYFDHRSIGLGLLKPIVFLFLTMYYARGYIWIVFVQHAIIICAVLFVGEERLVIFSYIVFMYYATRVNRGVNVGVLITSCYFFLKGILYLQGIYLYGDGFWRAM